MSPLLSPLPKKRKEKEKVKNTSNIVGRLKTRMRFCLRNKREGGGKKGRKSVKGTSFFPVLNA